MLLIAFSFDPLRRWLEKETDRLLFGAQEDEEESRQGNADGAVVAARWVWFFRGGVPESNS